jgi:hypothetical protein
MALEGNPLNKSWQLRRGSEVVGVLKLEYVDQPWIHCVFEPTPTFADYAALFEKERTLLYADNFEAVGNEFAKVWQEIWQQGFVIAPDDEQNVISKFLLHIDGAAAWFRY